MSLDSRTDVPAVPEGAAASAGYRETVTRIIAGRAGSIVLDVPDAGTRPTSDRVRESLFGALEATGGLDGAAVLDLYAGSGALALEAVSRGATSADLVEKSARAAAVATRNADRVSRAVGAGARVHVHRGSADTFLRSARGPFDIVFLDPPYDVGEAELAATLDLLVPLLADGADVIIERGSRSPAPALPEGLVATRSKRYGDTTLWWATTTEAG
jgi:16S rRNA (guanine966-N2)-methyltransferase